MRADAYADNVASAAPVTHNMPAKKANRVTVQDVCSAALASRTNSVNLFVHATDVSSVTVRTMEVVKPNLTVYALVVG